MSLARTNDATGAAVDLSTIFASGTFKNVWRGTYTGGARTGEHCVSKEFKTGSVFEDHYFEEEMNVVRRAQKIIDDFNNAGVIADCQIRLNTPEIWENLQTKHLSLIEPMIENFEKFNSNTGWAPVTGNAWSEAMQALSHFSYHDSNRKFLLCDLQGGSYKNGYVLTDPVIMSQAQNCGPADLGPDGIMDFFHHHQCGRYCSKRWVRPISVVTPRFQMQKGTTMVALPVRQSRTPLTMLPARIQE